MCGYPIDKDCEPVSLDEANGLTDTELNSLELDYGTCCIDELNSDNYVTVTKEMASDACDPSLEGRQIKW
jgi:hypothetical protein